jgi:streptogramin lyase
MWMINRGANRLLRVDAASLQVQTWSLPLGAKPYGMGVDSEGHPWINTNNLGSIGDRVYRFDIGSEQFVNAGGSGGYYRGMNHDRKGRAWVAGNKPCRLAAFDAQSDSLISDTISLPGCDTPVGISIDHDGFVWVVDQNGTAYKVDPDSHQIELTVTGLTGPYTYSDMTGAGLDLVVNPPG